jgi:tetratricopeptide (TPR) repeat protein
MPGENIFQRIAVIAVLTILLVLVYHPVRDFNFVPYDDDRFVYDNPHVRQGLTMHALQWAAAAGTPWGDHVHADYWRPLSFISHAADVEFFGMNPGPHHLISAGIHLLAVIALFCALTKLSRNLWVGAFASALFAIHPLHVESVAWIAERKDVLSGLFLGLTLWCYASYAEAPFRWSRYVTFIAAGLLALMCKPITVTLPCLLLVVDYWPLNRVRSVPWRVLLMEKFPLVAMAAGVALLTILSPSYGAETMETLPFWARAANAINSYAAYLGDLVWPSGLAVFYPHPGTNISWFSVGMSAAVLAVISGTAVWLRHRCPFLLAGWLWFLIALIPVSGILASGSQARADRYAYLSLIGIYLAISWGGAALARFVPRRWMYWCGGLAAIGALAVASYRQLSYWSDGVRLWARALEVAGPHYQVLNAYGAALANAGELEKAKIYYARAVEAEPRWRNAYLNIGNLLAGQGDYAGAVEWFERILKIRPHDADGLNALGMGYLRLGEPREASKCFEAALETNPRSFRALLELGRMHGKAGEVEKSAELLTRAVSASPGSVEALALLANTRAALGDFSGAIALYEKARAIDPSSPTVDYNLAVTFFDAGQTARAIEAFHRVITRSPDWPEAYVGLGDALMKQGDTQKALESYRRALSFRPGTEEWEEKLRSAAKDSAGR